MPNLRRVGSEAEDAAAEYLMAEGFTIVTRRYKAAHGEIDLVCLDGETLVFVEVKARWAAGYVPEEAIGERKLRNLARAASAYLYATEQPERDHRFDIVALDREGIRHHRDVLGGD